MTFQVGNTAVVIGCASASAYLHSGPVAGRYARSIAARQPVKLCLTGTLERAVDGTVFIHTNEKQLIGALVGAYAMRRNSRHPERFDVRLIEYKDYPFLAAREGHPFLREGAVRIWRNDDLQSFTPLRFMPPALMGFAGRAVVTDPDVFAVGDVHQLLTRDMQDKAILCRARSGFKQFASSVMLLDCARLTHWRCEEQFEQLFAMQRDYMDWISLRCEDPASIGLFEPEWNDFDRLTPATRLLHTTRRRTQPWKTGLPADFTPSSRHRDRSLAGRLRGVVRRLKGKRWRRPVYEPHPDAAVENFFFQLLAECLDHGLVTEALLREHMARDHIRHDAFDVLARTRRLAAA